MVNEVKLKVEPEGRPNIYLPDRKSLKAFIKSRKLKKIHNFRSVGPIHLGADHDVKSVLADIDHAERLAIFTDDSNMGHSLALVRNNELQCYDIGEIQPSNLDVL